MVILPLHPKLKRYLAARKLAAKFVKQARLLEENIFHPSLHVELLEPRPLKLFSFRIDRKYRAIFIFHSTDLIEIVDVNNHYQ